jgi:UDP-N-acetylmuramoyl-L-alanyl-D-glutamate--2,6-diaminopimelate ligase
MKICDILNNIESYELKNTNLDLDVDYLTNSSKDCGECGIYFCLNGLKYNGYDYIDEAVNNGAKILIVDNFIDYNIMQVKVDNVRKFMAIFASIFYNHPEKKLFLVGVTGTNGKTTITTLVYKILLFNKKMLA